MPLFLRFSVENAIRRFQVHWDSLKFKGTYQLFVYADDVFILGGSVYTRAVHKNTEHLK